MSATSAMNAAIGIYNAAAEDAKKCNCTWEWTSDDWHTLNLKSE